MMSTHENKTSAAARSIELGEQSRVFNHTVYHKQRLELVSDSQIPQLFSTRFHSLSHVNRYT